MGRPPISAYFVDLLRVQQAGFIAEYVWWFLGRPAWPAKQQPAKLPSFMVWARQNLTRHVIETHSGVRIDPDESDRGTDQQLPAITARPPLDIKNAGGAEFQTLTAAVWSELKRGNRVEAAQKSDDIMQAVRALRREPSARYLCFRNQRELEFLLESQPELRTVRVLDWSAADGIYGKAYLLSQAQSFTEALACLEILIQLAPLSAPAHREKGYVLNRLHRFEEALLAYSRAWELASHLVENGNQAGASLRGMAVVLVELGDLDRAESLLRDSLVIEPGNRVAEDELNYIAQLRQGRKPHAAASYVSTGLTSELLKRNFRIFGGKYRGPWPGVGVSFDGSGQAAPSEEALALLVTLGKVTRLSLARAKLAGDALRPVQNLTQLKFLDLNSTSFSDCEIQFVCNLPELRWLNLFRTKISDEGLAALVRLPKLEQLFLGSTAVTDAGLTLLSECRSLRYLDLEGNVDSDATLHILSQLKQLEGLNVACAGDQISKAGVEALLSLTNLRLLGLARPPPE